MRIQQPLVWIFTVLLAIISLLAYATSDHSSTTLAVSANMDSNTYANPEQISRSSKEDKTMRQKKESDEIVIRLATNSLESMIDNVRKLPKEHDEYRAIYLLRASEAIALNLILAASGNNDPEILAKKFTENLMWSVRAAKSHTQKPSALEN